MIEINPIHTKADYEKALLKIESLWGAKLGSPEGNALDVLATLVEVYEARHYPMPPPDPIEAIRFYMEQNNLNRADFEAVIGSRSHASEVLAGKRALSIAMVRCIADSWKIPAEILIRPITRPAKSVTPRRRTKTRRRTG